MSNIEYLVDEEKAEYLIIQKDVNNFIRLINSKYPLYINLVLDDLIRKHIYNDIVYHVIILFDIKGYQIKQIFVSDIIEDHLDFNYLYEEICLFIDKKINEIGI